MMGTHECRAAPCWSKESSVCEVTLCGPQDLAAEDSSSWLAPTEAAMRECNVDRLAQLGPGTKAELPSAVSPR